MIKTKAEWIIIIGLVVAFGPLLIALLSLPLGVLLNCESGGGSPGVCSIGGEVMGQFVWSLAMFHWFTLMTILPGLGISAVGLILHFIDWMRGKK